MLQTKAISVRVPLRDRRRGVIVIILAATPIFATISALKVVNWGRIGQ